jgi:hypothetical protein
MKKLKLKSIDLVGGEVLTRDQLKNVLKSATGGTNGGGIGGGPAAACWSAVGTSGNQSVRLGQVSVSTCSGSVPLDACQAVYPNTGYAICQM